MGPKIKAVIIDVVLTTVISALGFLCKTMWTTGQDVAALRSIMARVDQGDKAQWGLLRELNSNKESKDLEIAVLRRIQEKVVLPFLLSRIEQELELGKIKQPTPTVVAPTKSNAKAYKELLEKVKTPRKEIDTDEFIQRQMKKSR